MSRRRTPFPPLKVHPTETAAVIVARHIHAHRHRHTDTHHKAGRGEGAGTWDGAVENMSIQKKRAFRLLLFRLGWRDLRVVLLPKVVLAGMVAVLLLLLLLLLLLVLRFSGAAGVWELPVLIPLASDVVVVVAMPRRSREAMDECVEVAAEKRGEAGSEGVNSSSNSRQVWTRSTNAPSHTWETYTFASLTSDGASLLRMST